MRPVWYYSVVYAAARTVKVTINRCNFHDHKEDLSQKFGSLISSLKLNLQMNFLVEFATRKEIIKLSVVV